MAEDEHNFIDSVLSFPFSAHDRFMGPFRDSDLDDDDSVEIGTRNGAVSLSERRIQVNLQSDLFIEESNLMGAHENVSNCVNDSAFRVIEQNCKVGRNPLQLGSGFGDKEHGSRGTRVNVNERRNCNGNLSRVSGCRAAWGNSGSDSDSDYCCKVEGRGDAVNDDFHIGSRKENGSRNCNGSSSRVGGLRVVWADSDWDSYSGCDVEGFDNRLSRESKLGLGDKRRTCDSHDAVDVNDEFYIGRRKENRSRNCNGSSSVFGGSRAVWADWDSDCVVEGFDSHLSRESELGLGDRKQNSHYAVDVNDDFYIGTRKENDNRNCKGSSSRTGGLRAVWADWDSDSDCEVEGVDNCLVRESKLGDEKVKSHDAVNANDELSIGTRRDDASRDCNWSSSRVNGLRAVWDDWDPDADYDFEGFDSCFSGESDLGLGDQKHNNYDAVDVDVNDEFYTGAGRDIEGRNYNGSPSRVSGLRPVWADSDWDPDCEAEGIENVLTRDLEVWLGDQEHDSHDALYTDGDFCIGRRWGEDESNTCNGSSSMVSGLRAVWGESDSDFEFEEINDVLSRDLEVGLGDQEHATRDAVNLNEDFYIGGSRRDDESSCCNGSSSRDSRLRGVWGDSGSDYEFDDVCLTAHMHSDEGRGFGGENGNGRDHDTEVNHDFEWEGREAMFSFYSNIPDSARRSSDFALDIMWGTNNSNLNLEMENVQNDAGLYFGIVNDGINADEYEAMFGQFTVGENVCLERPPASKAIVEKLPSVVTSKEDVINEKALCAVCKDQIEVGGVGKELPCSHRYHVDCIIPWLEIRNTCPVCRFELPTDDPHYEQKRMSRAGHAAESSIHHFGAPF